MTHPTMPMEVIKMVNVTHMQMPVDALENHQNIQAYFPMQVFIIKRIVKFVIRLESITIIIMRQRMNILKEFLTVAFQILFSKFN